MDIEYKITADDQLIIKQARPWLSFMPSLLPVPETESDNPLVLFPNPTQDRLTIYCATCSLEQITITDMLGKVWSVSVTDALDDDRVEMAVNLLPQGAYIIEVSDSTGANSFARKFLKF